MTAPANTLPIADTPVQPSPRLQIGLALLCVYIIWGSTYLGLKIAGETIPPFMMTAVRFITAGGLMMAFLRLRGETLPTRIEWRNDTLVGSLMLGVGTGGVAFAEQWVDSGLAAVAVGAVPVWTSLYAGLFGKWPSRMEWAGLALGLVGVGLLNLENGMRANPTGALALVIGPMSWAFGSILSRRLMLPKGLMATAAQMLGGGAFLLIVSIVLRENLSEMPSARSLLALVYLITFGALVAFSAYMFLLRTVRPTLATSYAYVNPMVAVFLGVFLAGETITLVGIAAMGVILCGVLLLAFAKGKP
ncbi:drug/metabolite exporter YedA [bacterium]|nr:drug/metabolite exporter YedA [bacterium]